MRDEIRIRLSLGLIAVAVVHAVLLAVVFTALHRNKPEPERNDSWRVPVRPTPDRPSIGKVEKLQEPQEVNLQAQGEMKQQILFPRRRSLLPRNQRCQPSYCPQPSYSRQPTTTVVTQPPRPMTTPTSTKPAEDPTGSPTEDAAEPPVGQSPAEPATEEEPPADVIGEVKSSDLSLDAEESAPPAITRPAAPPPKKGYELAVFLAGDAQSQKLQAWFDEHPGLLKLREKCEFQTYTASNAIYQTRFAEIVPSEQFPVVLFQDATGGHIHAAGRTMIPSTADELFSDLRRGFQLYEQAKQAQKTGAMKTRGYSWDDAISPTLYLSADDCPDGYCPVEPADTWRPGDRIRDGLFDNTRDTRNALMWLSAGEMATIALVFVAVVLLGFILIKRGM